MARLTATERAERQAARGALEVMSVRRLKKIAEHYNIDTTGATTHLSLVNTLMNSYDKWRET